MTAGRTLPPECARLAAGLRGLRDRTGLSLAALAGRTPYSKSSWERYLNGKKLPPRQAVAELCRLADEPPDRLLALWELAEPVWSGRAAEGSGVRVPVGDAGPVRAVGAVEAVRAVGDAPDPDPAPAHVRQGRQGRWVRRGRPRAAFLASGVVAVVAAVVVPLVLTTGEQASGGQGPLGDAPAASQPYPQSYEPGCKGQDCEGADPQQMGCGAQGMVETLLRRVAAGGQRVELRYAEKCGAVWVRTMNLRLGDRVEVSLPGADPKEVRAATQRDTEVYLATAMTATRDPRAARVCLRPAAGGGPECFTV
ncbi:hypothetical protein GCM10010218_31650 [Streptomyces mashuensis]|uniref:HTH cro/C1-type domain-containing protein n=1 Tax=Streptomyces mashuensis TaxID=33904 RepID=A0A919B355_9ACTN|nr:XRE family transcriptional regulator [Streptomyces mashuensis]GHF47885.1 hypothetical protein GCM10010218_31650 [Streptomyces mashuensis]